MITNKKTHSMAQDTRAAQLLKIKMAGESAYKHDMAGGQVYESRSTEPGVATNPYEAALNPDGLGSQDRWAQKYQHLRNFQAQQEAQQAAYKKQWDEYYARNPNAYGPQATSQQAYAYQNYGLKKAMPPRKNQAPPPARSGPLPTANSQAPPPPTRSGPPPPARAKGQIKDQSRDDKKASDSADKSEEKDSEKKEDGDLKDVPEGEGEAYWAYGYNNWTAAPMPGKWEEVQEKDRFNEYCRPASPEKKKSEAREPTEEELEAEELKRLKKKRNRPDYEDSDSDDLESGQPREKKVAPTKQFTGKKAASVAPVVWKKKVKKPAKKRKRFRRSEL